MYRYFLEKARPTIARYEYSYSRRAASVFQTYRWKQVAVSNNLKALIKIAGSMHHIIDAETGAEVFRSAPNPLPY